MEPNLVIKIEAKIQWLVTETASGNFVAVCEPLGLVSEGSDQFDLWTNINSSIQLVMNDLLNRGELDSFLKSHGWTTSSSMVRSPGGLVPFDVPIELVRQEQQRGPSRTRPQQAH